MVIPRGGRVVACMCVGMATFIATTATLAVDIQSLDIKAGASLVSLWVEPDNPDAASIFMNELSSGVIEAIMAYEAGSDEWVILAPSHPSFVQDIGNIHLKARQGFWVIASQDVVVDVSGTMVSEGIPLNLGWDIVGYPSSETHTVDFVLQTAENDVDEVAGFEVHTADWALYSTGGLLSFAPGIGYWVQSQSEAYLAGPNEPYLHVPNKTLDFGSNYTVKELTIENIGHGMLSWSIQSDSRWILDENGTPVISDPPEGTMAGSTTSLAFSVDRSGLKPGLYDTNSKSEPATVKVITNGGIASVDISMAVQFLKLNGLYEGSLDFDHTSEPDHIPLALMFEIQPWPAMIVARIDARRAPSFATSMSKQPSSSRVVLAPGSDANGHVEIVSVPTDAAIEQWVLTAQGDVGTETTEFEVRRGVSTIEGVARLGIPFTASNNVTITVVAGTSPFMSGDQIKFDIGTFGVSEGIFTGPVANPPLIFSGNLTLEATSELSPYGVNVNRNITLSNVNLDEFGNLVGRYEESVVGLLQGESAVVYGTFSLTKQLD